MFDIKVRLSLCSHRSLCSLALQFRQTKKPEFRLTKVNPCFLSVVSRFRKDKDIFVINQGDQIFGPYKDKLTAFPTITRVSAFLYEIMQVLNLSKIVPLKKQKGLTRHEISLD